MLSVNNNSHWYYPWLCTENYPAFPPPLPHSCHFRWFDQRGHSMIPSHHHWFQLFTVIRRQSRNFASKCSAALENLIQTYQFTDSYQHLHVTMMLSPSTSVT
jgi:hypothetical protein